MGRIIYGHAFDGRLRFSAANMKDVIEEARLRHSLSPIAAATLGRALVGAALSIPWLAETETLTLDFETTGPIGRIVAQSKGNYTVRGYVSNPQVEGSVKDGKFEISKIVVGGNLRVVRDLGLKTPFVSQVPIVSGEIAQDLAYYYVTSEQMPTAIALGVLVGKRGTIAAGGYALQVIDRSIDEEKLQEIEDKVKKLGGITFHLRKGETLEDVLHTVLGSEFGDYLSSEVRFECQCSREKAFQSLLVLDLNELKEMKKEGFAEVTCKWCGKRYIFDEDDLELALIEKKDGNAIQKGR
jgi:molecular chaperone Hsp33